MTKREFERQKFLEFKYQGKTRQFWEYKVFKLDEEFNEYVQYLLFEEEEKKRQQIREAKQKQFEEERQKIIRYNRRIMEHYKFHEFVSDNCYVDSPLSVYLATEDINEYQYLCLYNPFKSKFISA